MVKTVVFNTQIAGKFYHWIDPGAGAKVELCTGLKADCAIDWHQGAK